MGSAGGAPRIETLVGAGDVALVGAGDGNATNVLSSTLLTFEPDTLITL